MTTHLRIRAPFEQAVSEVGIQLDKIKEKQKIQFYLSPYLSTTGYSTIRGFYIEYMNYRLVDLEIRSLAKDISLLDINLEEIKTSSNWKREDELIRVRNEIIKRLKKGLQEIGIIEKQISDEKSETNQLEFLLDPKRISKLRSIKSKFDLSKLIQYCEAVNSCYLHRQYAAVVILERAILDCVPPVFNAKNFSDVVNTYH